MDSRIETRKALSTFLEPIQSSSAERQTRAYWNINLTALLQVGLLKYRQSSRKHQGIWGLSHWPTTHTPTYSGPPRKVHCPKMESKPRLLTKCAICYGSKVSMNR